MSDDATEFPCSPYWRLFKHMSDEHGLTLTDSELADICLAVDETRAGWREKEAMSSTTDGTDGHG